LKSFEIAFLKQALAEAKKENEKAEETHKADMAKMKEQGDSIDEIHANIEKSKENIIAEDEENGKLLESLIFSFQFIARLFLSGDQTNLSVLFGWKTCIFLLINLKCFWYKM
ncbi:hypothetical protein ACJX0J_022224, partial [Zea mays]